MTMTHRPYHFVAIVGGAIAGSIAAEIFADSDSWIASVTPLITAGQVDFPTDIALEATRQSSAAFYCAECR
jgi:hypothetical protein